MPYDTQQKIRVELHTSIMIITKRSQGEIKGLKGVKDESLQGSLWQLCSFLCSLQTPSLQTLTLHAKKLGSWAWYRLDLDVFLLNCGWSQVYHCMITTYWWPPRGTIHPFVGQSSMGATLAKHEVLSDPDLLDLRYVLLICIVCSWAGPLLQTDTLVSLRLVSAFTGPSIIDTDQRLDGKVQCLEFFKHTSSHYAMIMRLLLEDHCQCKE